jgi:protein-tyrosine phosphatase
MRANALIVAFVVLCAPGAAMAQTVIKLGAAQASVGSLPLLVAKTKGYFAAEGIVTETFDFKGGAPAVQALGFLPRGNIEMFAAINAGQLDAEEAVQAMMDQYRNLTLDHHDRYQAFIETLLGPGSRPLLFHCASGKDRTGIAAAIVLLALDVPRATVLEDYAISNFQRRPIDLFTAGASAPAVEQVLAAHPRYLEAALTAMEETSGSIPAYLAELGLNSEARRHLRALLVA